jgi:hypothetical protein
VIDEVDENSARVPVLSRNSRDSSSCSSLFGSSRSPGTAISIAEDTENVKKNDSKRGSNDRSLSSDGRPFLLQNLSI